MADINSARSSMKRFRHFLTYWSPAVVWMILIFIGSTNLLSAEHTSRFLVPLLRWLDPQISLAALAAIQLGVRKLGHLTEYAVLAMLLWRALRSGTRWQMKMSILFLVAAVACAIFAASDEFHQSFVPSRTPSPHDVMIDICGAFLGLAVCWMFARRKRATVTV
jgi:VanZ family protein